VDSVVVEVSSLVVDVGVIVEVFEWKSGWLLLRLVIRMLMCWLSMCLCRRGWMVVVMVVGLVVIDVDGWVIMGVGFVVGSLRLMGGWMVVGCVVGLVVFYLN